MRSPLPCLLGWLVMLFCSSAHAGSTLFWLRFEGGKDNAALGTQTDTAGGATATVSGTCLYSTAVAPYAAAGTSCFNARADFDYLTVPDRVSLRPAGDFTIELLARPASPYPSTGGATGHMIVSKQIYNNGGAITSWGIGYDHVTQKFFGIVCIGGNQFGGTQYAPVSETVANPGAWHHVALVYRRLTLNAHAVLYVDGVKQSDVTMPLTPVNFTTYSLYVGAGNYGSGGTDFYRRNFAGMIDEVRLSNVALTPSQFLVTACPGDLNGDNQVDDVDFILFASAYNTLDCADPAMAPGCPSDFNRDDIVTDADFLMFVSSYDQVVCP